LNSTERWRSARVVHRGFSTASRLRSRSVEQRAHRANRRLRRYPRLCGSRAGPGAANRRNRLRLLLGQAQYHELPELLWATTGIKIQRLEQFQKFGKLRNASVHFSVPEDEEWHGTTVRFLFEVIEPLVDQFGGESMVPYAAVWDEYVCEPDGLLMQLEQCEIELTPNLKKPWASTSSNLI
jgi:hypothetical protein